MFRGKSFLCAITATLFFATLSSCTKNADEASIRTYADRQATSISQELSNKRITAFGEDDKGHVWIGTFRGLNKYDTHDFHQYYFSSDNSSISDNQINDIFRDSQGRMWICTLNGACVYTDKDCFERMEADTPDNNIYQAFESMDSRMLFSTNYKILEFNPQTKRTETRLTGINPSNSQLFRCHVDRSNRLWTASVDGLRCYSLEDFSLLAAYDVGMNVTACLFDAAKGTVWLAGLGKIAQFDLVSGKLKPLPEGMSANPALANESINIIHPYGNGSLLLNSFSNGLLLLDTSTGKIIRHDESGFPFDAPEFGIFRMFTDSQQNLWLGSYDQGVVVKNSRPGMFNNDKYLQSLVKGKSVMDVDIDSEGRLWITTMLDGVQVYDPNTHYAKSIFLYGGVKSENSPYWGISSMEIDGEDNIYLACLFADKVFKCRYDGSKIHLLSTFDIPSPHAVKSDSKGRLWVGTTTNSLVCIDGDSGKTRNVTLPEGTGGFISGIQPMDDGRLLITALKQMPYIVDTETMQARKVNLREDEWEGCFERSFFIPTDLCLDSFGQVWMGTVGNGLLRWSPADGSIRRIEGASCTDISSIIEDHQGNIWISSQFGLSRYDRTADKFVHFFESDGTGGNQYYDRASCIMNDGTLVFGGTHGLTVFNPADVSAQRKVPLVFENLKVHNSIVSPEHNPEIMSTHLSNCPKVTLNHRQNGFGISFAALDYSGTERPHYLFKLEGHDRYWIDARSNHECYYANLPAGHYTFRVKITGDCGSLAESEITLPVTIKPAPWLSWWAILLYSLVLIGIAGAVMTTRKKVRRTHELAKRAIFEKEQEKRINRMNMSFFANIAHEFRTPLTMISGPLNQLEMSQDIRGGDREILSIIKHSVVRMLKLVNQLMDFNKLENDTLLLCVERADAVAYIKSSIEIFRMNAENKGISFNTEGLDDGFICLLDADKLDKILNNLLSNALKFTPPGGKISLSFDVIPTNEASAALEASQFKGKTTLQAPSYIKIVVDNSGPGIPKELAEKIFECYYQLTDSNRGKYNWGTGIGLYYSRALALLHHGALFLQTKEDCSTSSSFVLLLPANDESYSEQERMQPSPKIATGAQDSPVQDSPVQISPAQAFDAATAAKEGKEQEGKAVILVVEDDIDVVHYLKTLLSPFYKVISAYNGEEAIPMAEEHHPKLIISDVVMPGMDGYELCRHIKEDMHLSHIPVILVTAQAGMESQILGLNTGADAYVAKPFDTKYLMALIRSLLSNREKLQGMLSQATKVGKIGGEMLSGPDKVFMDELYSLMEKEMSTSELDIMRMTEMMHISRTKFYYKIKELTGQSPANFFRTYKLNRAAELIREGRYNVSEIADLTGFSTHAHFTTSFKKQFGVTPSAYASNPDGSEKDLNK